MQLVEPTDFDILAYLDSDGRNNAVNLAAALDRNRAYMNTRLRTLREYGCVRRVGPADNSGLYEITETGRAALKHRAARRDPSADFDELVRAEVESAQSSSDD